MNVEPTAEAIDDMAKRLREYAWELEKISGRMRDSQDLTYSAQAINTISNCINNLRLDLLVSRPLREVVK